MSTFDVIPPRRRPSRQVPLWQLLLAAAGVVLLTTGIIRGAFRPAVDSDSGLARPRAGAPEADAARSADRSQDAEDSTAGGHLVHVTVAPGDTLSEIADRFGISPESLMAMNGLKDPDALQIGQVLQLREVPTGEGPAAPVLPDAEVVYGPAYADWDLQAFLASQPGRLRDTQELVNGVKMTGPQIVARVARDFSVGPRVLLAVIEARSGWVTGLDQDPDAVQYPAGLHDPGRVGLWLQLNWLADRLNGGYYDWTTRDNRLLSFTDGIRWSGHPAQNPGSFAVQRVLGLQAKSTELPGRLAAFDAAYRKLFGDPWAHATNGSAASVGPGDSREPSGWLGGLGGLLGSASTGTPRSFPALQLPWSPDEQWWMTGGPHGGWAVGSAWAALDFVPDDAERGCYVSPHWVTAVADGVAVEAENGAVWLDLDGDGSLLTGPVVFHLHVAAEDRVAPGTRVKAGDKIGHPSCEGGISEATHLHIARLLDGEWLAAGGAVPFQLGRWRAEGGGVVYEGALTDGRGGRRESCECRVVGENDVGW